MEFEFGRPHCGQHLTATLADVGTVSSCPTCSEPIAVPHQTEMSLNRRLMLVLVLKLKKMRQLPSMP